MIYGHRISAPARGAELLPLLDRASDPAGYRAWRRLDDNRRLQLVDRALKPANDLIDAYPLAL